MNERKAFEQWAKDNVVNDASELEMKSNGDWLEYVDDHIETLWLGWIARAESTAHRESDSHAD